MRSRPDLCWTTAAVPGSLRPLWPGHPGPPRSGSSSTGRWRPGRFPWRLQEERGHSRHLPRHRATQASLGPQWAPLTHDILVDERQSVHSPAPRLGALEDELHLTWPTAGSRGAGQPEGAGSRSWSRRGGGGGSQEGSQEAHGGTGERGGATVSRPGIEHIGSPLGKGPTEGRPRADRPSMAQGCPHSGKLPWSLLP